MAEQEWLSPATAPSPSEYENVYAAPMAAAPAYDLRPLTLGELLDRTFSIYRSRFWLFCGIAAIASAVELVLAGAGRIGVHRYTHDPATVYGAAVIVTYVAGFIYFFVYCVTQAATTFAMSEVYLGRPTSTGAAFRAVRGKWYAWIGIGLWQIWSASWIFTVLFIPFMVLAALKVTLGAGTNVGLIVLAFVLVVAATVYGFIAYIRNSLAIPAKVMEGMPVRKAMRRSKDLAAGAKGRIFVVGLIVFAMNMVAGVLQMPFAFMMANFRTGTHVIAEMTVLLITFFAHSVVTPVASIGLCLVYFDQRVRREAFDLEFLLGPEQTVAVAGPVEGLTQIEPSASEAQVNAVQVAEPQADAPQI